MSSNNFTLYNELNDKRKKQTMSLMDNYDGCAIPEQKRCLFEDAPEATTQYNPRMNSKSVAKDIKTIDAQCLFRDFIQWEGRVIQLEQNGFVARVFPVRKDSAPLIVRFNNSKITIVNPKKMIDGATFVWTVGHASLNEHAPITRQSIVHFRLIPNIDMTHIEQKLADRAKELIEGINWLD